jgi:RNA polymerase sigma-70 factor, ECF subfamily
MDRDTLQGAMERHRRELQVHCYRMLGSFHDAEDLVQETFLRAWRGIDGFEARASIRGWLYRIATNACLNVLASRARASRVLPDMQGPAFDRMPDPAPASDVPWLEPCPDVAIEGAAAMPPGPDARYELREAVRLSFIAAIQSLPPRQRAVLLLHDVVGWSAAEVADLLDGSVASVNSLIQRARATLDARLPEGRTSVTSSPTDRQRALLDRYLRSWESVDVASFVDLLQEEAVLSMPPWPHWYRGRAAIGTVFSWTARLGGHGPFRLVPTGANGQPAFAFYSRFQGTEWRAHSIQVLTLDGDAVAEMTSFITPSLFGAFGLPATLPSDV